MFKLFRNYSNLWTGDSCAYEYKCSTFIWCFSPDIEKTDISLCGRYDIQITEKEPPGTVENSLEESTGPTISSLRASDWNHPE